MQPVARDVRTALQPRHEPTFFIRNRPALGFGFARRLARPPAITAQLAVESFRSKPSLTKSLWRPDARGYSSRRERQATAFFLDCCLGTARESNPASIFGNRPNFPSCAFTAGIIAAQWSKGGTGTLGSGSLTGAATDAVRRRLHKRVPGAITGFTFRATHCRRAAQGRIKQDKQCDGTDTNPHAANQHGCSYQKAPLPIGQPPPAVAQTSRDCDGVHCRHSVPIHDLSAELLLTTVHLSAPPFRWCSTQRRA